MKRLAPVTCRVVFSLVIFFSFSACSEKKSPEDQVRQFVDSAVAAAQSREALAIRQLVSEHYTDENHRDRRALVGLAMTYFLRHKNIHLFTQISEITFSIPAQASVKLYVAMAGRPVKGAQALIDIRANLYQFDLVLEKNGNEWLLQGSRWRSASIEELVNGM